MSRRRRHHGLTLLEILLVLALLVIIGAVAAPAIGRFVQTQRLRDSANLIRGEWSRARVQAMKSGRIHVFRYEPAGRQYVVDYWMAADDQLEAGDDREVVTPEIDSPWDAEKLPEGIRFLLGQTEEGAEQRLDVAEAPAETGINSGAGWSPPILFYSDGTTSDADIVLVNKRNTAIRISLRGLTGIGTVSDTFRLDNTATEAP